MSKVTIEINTNDFNSVAQGFSTIRGLMNFYNFKVNAEKLPEPKKDEAKPEKNPVSLDK